ncbi:AfsR/SARP family transcriptional regulator [Virgisporangium aurantiacum]|uniref:SARP family transcriptional regulator n=1 Tax=Virgisporangium aurantiacum TaxID=175570 RepID=A0A8J3ZGQ0_9ACTN|nr:BTAD domain-containing putative transcriptional regulator [Virgisporangium aurantiacum]GIJ61280.1 SARP family transcriptional regulator [Virgisporangium aurantiacum]
MSVLAGLPVEVRILGPVQVIVEDRTVDLGPPKRRLLLALLALECGSAVPLDRLIDLCWERPPSSARGVVFAHMSRLRKALAGAARHGVEVVSNGSAYTLRADPSAVDARRFRQLVTDAAAVDDAATRARMLGAALDLWRGQPLEGLALGAAAQRLCVGLDELRLAATEDRIAADLAAGAHHRLVPELSDLVARHPLREPLAGHLMLALYRAGNQTGALETYRRIRTDLADRLGLDPGPALTGLHQAILRRDPSLDLTARGDTTTRPVPAQLPPAPAGFSGRRAAIADLDRISADAAGGPGLVAVWGAPGVGKTTLALHWAHRAADRYPDGQLHVDLRGFGPDATPMAAAEALRGFLDAFGVAPQAVPAGLTARTGLYRSLLAGRRVLVILDNAAASDQVRPLLPASPGSFVVVTSRNKLTGLVAVDGARPVALARPDATDARQMLAARVGVDTLREAPRAASEVVAACARLPLAIGIAAARLAVDPDLSLPALARELETERTRLDVLDGGEPATRLRAVFSWSYRRLDDDAARVFRLMSLYPGAVVTLPAAASLAGYPVERTRAALAGLTGAHLVEGHGPERYSCHDLLRAYGAELAEQTDPADERAAACRRLYEHQLHSAFAADRLLNPGREPIAPAPAGTGVTPADFATTADALAWFGLETPALLRSLRTAGDDRFTFELAWTLADVLEWQGRWLDLAGCAALALAALRRLGDRTEQARTLRIVAQAYLRLGRYADAETRMREALDVSVELGDVVGVAHAHHSTVMLLSEQGRHADALPHAREALRRYRAVGHRLGQGRALNAIAWCTAVLGDHRAAIDLCEEALAAARESEDQYGEAAIWDTLGFAHQHLGDLHRAIEAGERALATYVRIEDRFNEAHVLAHLGDVRARLGEHDRARAAWETSAAILDRLDPAGARRVHARLRADVARPGGQVA